MWLKHPDSGTDKYDRHVKVEDNRRVTGVDGVTTIVEYRLSYQEKALRHGNAEEWFEEGCVKK